MSTITNYDHCLRCQVLDKRLSLIDLDTAEVVADNRGNICVHIEFDEQWDGCGKTARFIYEGMWKDVVLNSDNECICPSEVIKKGRFYLGVYGADLKTTTPLAITVAPSILSESGEELPDDPTPGQYEQIMTLYASTTQAADEATQACWDAIGAANSATQALNNAKDELENGGFITSIKEKNKGIKLGFWVGTTEEYEKLSTKPINCYVILTDDNTLSELRNALDMKSKVLFGVGSSIQGYVDVFTELEGINNYTTIIFQVDFSATNSEGLTISGQATGLASVDNPKASEKEWFGNASFYSGGDDNVMGVCDVFMKTYDEVVNGLNTSIECANFGLIFSEDVKIRKIIGVC